MTMNAKCTVQDIFNRFYPGYEKKHKLSHVQRKAAYSIMNCKTGSLGVNISVCEDCGCISIHANSCRNRSCPMCQEFRKEKWMDARREDVLDAPYFHVVFTVPDDLNPVIYSNQKVLYDALYRAVSATLHEVSADSRYLGAETGFICILHTWGSAMNYHPHIHTILLGGGLTGKNQWKTSERDFFAPVRVMSRLFRGKYMAELKKLWEDGKLEFHGTAEKYRNHYAFKELMDICYKKEWNVHCKETFNGAQSVIKYLGNYTHRIAISNCRIRRMDEKNVTYAVKDYKNAGHWKELTIPGEEFIRRFLMHVPPKRFVRIRHYGILSARNKRNKLTLCRNLSKSREYISRLKNMSASEMLNYLYGIDICKCNSCGGHMAPYPSSGKPAVRVLHLRC